METITCFACGALNRASWTHCHNCSSKLANHASLASYNVSPLSVSAPEKEGEMEPHAGMTQKEVVDFYNRQDRPKTDFSQFGFSPPSPPRKTLEECMCEILKIKDTELSSYLSINVVDVKNISRLFASQQGNGWISVEDKTPTIGEKIDIWVGLRRITNVTFSTDTEWFSHWMPLPLPPNT